jgi:hypothetical protein
VDLHPPLSSIVSDKDYKGVSMSPDGAAFLKLLNAARANPAAYGQSIGVDLSSIQARPPLADSAMLDASALAHSNDMATKNFFGHNGSNGSSPGQRISAAGYQWTTWAESIAAGTATAEETLASLIKDAGTPDLGHRRMLLGVGSPNDQLRDVGIALAIGGSYGYYWTIDAGASNTAPAPQPPPGPAPGPTPAPQPAPAPSPVPTPRPHRRPWWRRPSWLPAFFPWFAPGTSNGAQMIAHERHRQLTELGWTPQHDAEFDQNEMAYAAACYAIYPGMVHANMQFIGDVEYPKMWPWAAKHWKPKDAVTDLVRAGALIAAEIDRLLLKGESK